MLRLGALFAVVLLAAARPSLLEDDDLETVSELDISKYAGRWYQVYGNRYGWFGYGAEAVCISATYTAINSTAVDVLNANRVSTGDGEFRSLPGVAWQSDPENEPGKLFVQLQGVPFAGDYWIAKLGPADFMINDKPYYQWAVVSNANRESLYILARDTGAFFGSQTEKDILAWAQSEGFTEYFTRPIAIEHPANCIYPPEPDMP